jgi:hypothetical protein
VVVEKNVSIPERFFDNHYKGLTTKSTMGILYLNKRYTNFGGYANVQSNGKISNHFTGKS